MGNQSKHVFLTLEERNGEREYTHKSVHILNKEENIDEWAEEYASTYLIGKSENEDDGKSEKQDDGYYFNGGQYCVSISLVKEISEEDFNILQKYL